MSRNIALILDGSQRSALAATRSLGKQGISVITGSESNHALCRHSKYSSQHVIYPSPSEFPEKFIAWLESFLRSNNIDVILPMTDITCNILAPFSPKIDNTHIPLASLEKIQQLSNKSALMQVADSLGVPVPKTIYINNILEIDNIKKQLSYPCVIKPALSRYLKDGEWQSTAVKIIHSEHELEKCLTENDYLSDQPFMVQQYIDGVGQGIFSLYDKGKELAWFAHRRIREKPPWGGVSVLSESIALPKEMVTLSKKLLDHVDWHGVAMIEFKVATDGTPYLIEINTRFWGSLQLAIDSGVDFPKLLFQTTANDQKPIVKPGAYSTGNRLRWFLGDTDSLIISLKRKKQTTFKEKLKVILKFFLSFQPKNRNEVFRFDDPKPGIFEIKEYLKQFIKAKP